VLRLSAATVIGAPRRSALAAATVAIGFGAVVWLWTIAHSFQQSVITLLPGKLRGDLSVTSAHALGFVEAPVSAQLLDELRRVAGVAAVIGEQSTDTVYAGGPIALDAFDAVYFTDPRFGRWRLSGSSRTDALEVVARGEGVIVSENFVRNLGQGLGDTLRLPTPSGTVQLPIVGVIVDFLSPRGTVNVSRELYSRLWRDDQIVRALVVVDAGTDASEVGRRITSSLGSRLRLRVLTIPALMDWFAEQVGRAFAALYALAGLVLVIVVAGVGDALAAGVIERTRDFGTARALGASRGTLTRLVLTEAALVGVVGLAIAWSVGLALGALWVSSVFPALVGWTLALHVPLAALLLIGAGALATCMIAAYAPARGAARIEPARALRAE
jgi:putative ABC transport system permease protein